MRCALALPMQDAEDEQPVHAIVQYHRTVVCPIIGLTCQRRKRVVLTMHLPCSPS